MKKIFQFLFSTRFSAILFGLFAVSIAIATVIENDFGTSSAKALVYNAAWFELLILLILVNLSGSIIRNELYKRDKFSLFIFHLAIVIIFLGAAFTRYTGFAGIMHIREGNTSNQILTENSYISLNVISGQEKMSRYKKVLFAPLIRNSFEEKFSVSGQMVTVKLKEYYNNAEEVIENDSVNGTPMIQLFVTENNRKISCVFRDKETEDIRGISFTFNDTTKNGINIFFHGGKLFIKSPFDFAGIKMADQSQKIFRTDSVYAFEPLRIYIFDKVSCELNNFSETGIVKAKALQNAGRDEGKEALLMSITCKNREKETIIWKKKNQPPDYQTIIMEEMQVRLSYGSILLQIPFSLKLIDFKIDHYPGSNSPSSFESKVLLTDKTRGIEDTGRIYMNNILKYRGYRFYQTSYDTDEQGTVLTVNRDFPGTLVTYLGYILLVLGITLSLFNPSSRLRKLNEQSKKIYLSRCLIITPIIVVLLLVFTSCQSSSQDSVKINPIVIIPASQANSFGKTWVQDDAGRIKPLNTLSSGVLRKLTHKNKFRGLNSDQIFLSMIVFPEYWKTIPLIKITNYKLRDTLKINTKYAAYADLNTYQGFILKSFVENAYMKKPSKRNKFDNDVLKLNDQYNICDLTFAGRIAKIFPSKVEGKDNMFTELPKETQLVLYFMHQYVEGILEGLETGNYSSADKYLQILRNYQIQEGQHIVPSFRRTNLEIFYNKLQIFRHLSALYGVIGFILLVLTFITIFIPNLKLEKYMVISIWFIVAGFLIHSAGLIIRWNIAVHAPWSNGYESMLYLSWATVLAGLVFSKRSRITLAVTVLLSYLTLYIAHLSWMDPEITNLEPVLKSFWLLIHVAIITASYAFFAIVAFLALINLLLMRLKNILNVEKIESVINELTCIIEMALIIGLYLIAIGTILGGVWANQSWGRYWGWDPKETWTLVTIIIYAFIAHLRLIPEINKVFLFNLMALLGFGSVIMTYFGVNYYLSGLHSYARVEQPHVPPVVYVIMGLILFFILQAYFKQRKSLLKNKTV